MKKKKSGALGIGREVKGEQFWREQGKGSGTRGTQLKIS